MPRIARKNSQSNYYHIIVQGINREYIFNEKKDIEKYKEIIKSKLEKSNIQILAYCGYCGYWDGSDFPVEKNHEKLLKFLEFRYNILYKWGYRKRKRSLYYASNCEKKFTK